MTGNFVKLSPFLSACNTLSLCFFPASALDKYDGFMYKHVKKGWNIGRLIKNIFRSDKYKLNDARYAAQAFMPKWEEFSMDDDDACQRFVAKVSGVIEFIREWEHEDTDKTERQEVIACFF